MGDHANSAGALTWGSLPSSEPISRQGVGRAGGAQCAPSVSWWWVLGAYAAQPCVWALARCSTGGRGGGGGGSLCAGGGALGGTGGSALAFGAGGPEWEPSASFSREGRCGAGTGCNVTSDCGNRVASGGVGASSGVGVILGGPVPGAAERGLGCSARWCRGLRGPLSVRRAGRGACSP